MSGEEDAGREIFGYTSHLPVPTWVDSKAYAACHHCAQKFSSLKESTKQHHCRLCGHMYCGACTAKYHVPLIYEQKGKKGPTRVCIRCRDSCLAQKEKEKQQAAAAGPHKHAVLSAQDISGGAPTGAAAKRGSTLIGGAGVLEITPPVWDDADKFVDCRKCHKKGGKPHNCRTCGHLFCDSCTSKMDIPAFFEKKAKSGPARVCGECRFKILAGARLVEKPGAPDANTAGKIGGRVGKDSTMCIAPGCTAPKVSTLGLCAAHVNELGGKAQNKAKDELGANASVVIRWEGEASALAKVALTDKHMSLLHIDVALKKSVPELGRPGGPQYEYLFKNECIADVFFDVFTAQTFMQEHGSSGMTVISIRKKFDTDAMLASYTGAAGATSATAAAANAAAGPVTAVSTKNNPFLRKEGDERKVQELKEPVKVVVPEFKPPTKAKRFDGTANSVKKPAAPTKGPPPLPGAAPANKPPPPPLPSAGAANGAPATDAVFKARAKQYFGAL